MSVIAFTGHGRDEHLAGRARCIACGHEWQAVGRIGASWLECPSCGTMKGLYKFPCAPDEGDHIWTCPCGSDALYATPKSLRCCNCGAAQRPFD
jgi:hypothetical protein